MNLISGYATAEGTQAYAQGHGERTGEGHFSDFLDTGIQLSSIGLGTFSGIVSEQVDSQMASVIAAGLQRGLNVIDTATHYRYGHSLMAVKKGIRLAMEQGVAREAMFLVSKGGFLSFPDGGLPADFEQWFRCEIEKKSLGSRAELSQDIHLISPAYIRHQLTQSRLLMGVAVLDVFLVDQPEIHIPDMGKEQLNRKLFEVFVELEKAVQEGELRHYGISTFDGFRVETDNLLFQSLTSLLGLAEKAAQAVWGQQQSHHFAVVQMPYNIVMSEGFTRFNQATGQGNIASTLQAAYQLGVYVMTSHSLMKGRLCVQPAEGFPKALLGLPLASQKSIQFNRSTPGVGTTLVGISQPQHLEELYAVCQAEVLKKQQFVSMFERLE